MDSLTSIQQECKEDSEKWFQEKVSKNISHQALALAGEVGEFCNVLKKLQRDDVTDLTLESFEHLADELCDVFIYTVNIANILKVNLGAGYSQKRDYNEKRFKPPLTGTDTDLAE